MAHYVMSDIHGEADRFHAMLEKIHFSDDDTLYILGDVINREPDGISLLREIMASPEKMSKTRSGTDRRWILRIPCLGIRSSSDTPRC